MQSHPTTDLGPLRGIRVLEFGGKGAAPYCAMLLADMGADVVRIDRVEGVPRTPSDRPPRDRRRGRRSIAVDLKRRSGIALLEGVLPTYDVVIEGFRPGVMERLGFGPDYCLALHPSLVYGRVTGWGQTGPYSNSVGHDINYIAIASMLASVGAKGGKPLPPLNLGGDGAGGMLAAYGILCALLESRLHGVGGVVDAAMLDAAASLMGTFYFRRPYGLWNDERGTNKVDGGAPFYDTYLTADERYVAVGAIEPEFYEALIDLLKLGGEDLPDQWDEARWDDLRSVIAKTIRTRTQAEWVEAAAGTASCLTAVLDMNQAPDDPHNQARDTFIRIDDLVQPAPAPRFNNRVVQPRQGVAHDGEHTSEVLREWGLELSELERLRSDGVIAQL